MSLVGVDFTHVQLAHNAQFLAKGIIVRGAWRADRCDAVLVGTDLRAVRIADGGVVAGL